VIVQLKPALLPPLELATLTLKLWLPIARPLYVVGEVQSAGCPLSSEQVVVETVPVVVQLNDALVEVVELGGVLVRVTVGAPGGAVVELV
jgi:hypothetical protein